MRVLVDTSSILFGFENRRSAFEAVAEQFDRAYPEVSKGIISELAIISSNAGRKGAAARAALAEIKAKKVRIANTLAYPDAWIAREAQAHADTVVVTNDTGLARRLPKEAMVLKMSRNGRLRRFAVRR